MHAIKEQTWQTCHTPVIQYCSKGRQLSSPGAGEAGLQAALLALLGTRLLLLGVLPLLLGIALLLLRVPALLLQHSICYQGVLHWPAAEVSLESRSGHVLCWSHRSFDRLDSMSISIGTIKWAPQRVEGGR